MGCFKNALYRYRMHFYLVLMLGVLLNSAVSQDTSGDHQCGPGQEQCLQNSVERMRYEMDAMQDDLRRLTRENQKSKAGLQNVIFYLLSYLTLVMSLECPSKKILVFIVMISNILTKYKTLYYRHN